MSECRIVTGILGAKKRGNPATHEEQFEAHGNHRDRYRVAALSPGVVELVIDMRAKIRKSRATV